MPTQLGKHWWPNWSKVAGVRVDYLSPTLYLLDLILVGLVVLNWRKLKPGKRMVWFLGLAVINIVVATNRWVAGMFWIRWLEAGVWMAIVASNWQKVKTIMVKVIPIWIIGEVFLGIAQVVRGSSLQGWWYWLGERRFDYNSIGVAKWAVGNEGLVRAYGTFSHPNSLAGFILVAVLVWLKVRERQSCMWKWIVAWTAVIGVIISGSRLVWIIGGSVIVGELYKRMRHWKAIVGGVAIMTGVLLLIAAGMSVNYQTDSLVGGWDKSSLLKRWELNKIALGLIKQNPLLGLGGGNFVAVNEMAGGWLQPVHNMGLLLIVELGLAGVLIWGVILRGKKGVTRGWKIVLGVILITGMMDHYWITLPQNRWLVATIAGLMWGEIKKGAIIESAKKANN